MNGRRDSKGKIEVSLEVQKFHRKALVIDLHTDCLIASRFFGLDLGKRHRPPVGMLTPWWLHADIPKMEEGGIDAVCLGIVTLPFRSGAYRRALRNMEYARYVVEKHSEKLAWAPDSEGIIKAKAKGKIGVMLGVEGMHMLEGEVERIANFYEKGARYFTLTHFTSNDFATSSADFRLERGVLSGLGREAVTLMNDIGMIIDLSHTHTDVIAEVCRLSSKPVIASHSATYALRPTFRNLTDRDIKDIADTGGVVGLIYANDWISATNRRNPPLSLVVDHADHIKKLVGVDHIALGSDWDGFIRTPQGMNDASDLPKLTQLFFDRGYTEEEVEKILGLNFLRVMREAAS